MEKIRQLVQKISNRFSSLFLLSIVLAAEKGISLKPTGAFKGLLDITIPEMVPVIIRVIFILAALVALVFLIIGGIKWITAGGDKAATESARATITSALVGLMIVLAAYAIIRLIEFFFSVSILELKIPSILPQPYITPQ